MATEVKITQDEVRIDSDWIEAGDLANEIGKLYIKGLDSAIKDGAQKGMDVLYFIVKTEKDPTDLKRIEITIAITDKLFNKMFESMDFWEYNYKTEKKRLLWSVPHRIDMKNFLRAEHKYSKDLIRWIRAYLKQNPTINLEDKSCVIMK